MLPPSRWQGERVIPPRTERRQELIVQVHRKSVFPMPGFISAACAEHALSGVSSSQRQHV
jgi:hypothetical protein